MSGPLPLDRLVTNLFEVFYDIRSRARAKVKDAQAAQRAAEARAAEAEAAYEALRLTAESWEDIAEQDSDRAAVIARDRLAEMLQDRAPSDALTTYIQSLPDDHPAIAGRLAKASAPRTEFVRKRLRTTQPTTDEGGSDGVD